jgi:hypothetical protein
MDVMGIGSKVWSLWNCHVIVSVQEFVEFSDSASIEQVYQVIGSDVEIYNLFM